MYGTPDKSKEICGKDDPTAPKHVFVFLPTQRNSTKHWHYHARLDCRAIRSSSRVRRTTLDSVARCGVQPCAWCYPAEEPGSACSGLASSTRPT